MLNIGIDIGGTRIKTGLLRDSKIIASSVLDVSDSVSLENELPHIESQIQNMLLLHRNSDMDGTEEKINGAGIALPCIVDNAGKRILSEYVKYKDAALTDIEGWVRRVWNTGLTIENDARAALIGESQFGACRGTDNVVLITIGTGIGTAVMLDGKLLRGRSYLAGNLGGHMCIDYRGNSCNCGDTGCAETVGSSWALPGRAGSLSGIDALVTDNGIIDFEYLFRAAKENNQPAKELINDCIKAWSAVVKNMIYAYDPEIIVLSGGVSASSGMIIPLLQKEIDSLSWLNNEPPVIVAAQHPDLAGVMGAAWLSRENGTNRDI
jgi:glucokinase